MKKRILALCALMAAAAACGGAWTSDFEAAKKTSREKNLPMMLDFTGSDWCGWCKLMDRKVFAERAWDAWAATNLVCVTVDFPQDASRIAPAAQARNEALARRFGVRGFPTFVLLAPGGGKELGRTGCPGRDVTPAVFIEQVERTLGRRPAAK